jgi:ankyrin repeat protein
MDTESCETLRSISRYDWLRTDILTQCAEGNHGIVQSAVTTGVALDRGDGDGWNALILASQNGHIETVKVLFDRELDVNSATIEGLTSLHMAAQEGHVEVVNFLLERGADFDALANNGCSALHLAANRGHLQVIEILIEWGSTLDSFQTETGEGPVLSASRNGHLSVLALLLSYEQGLEQVNRAMTDGTTPLLAASFHGRHEVITLLLRKGADLLHRRKDGKSALDLCLSRRHTEAEKILRENLALGVIRDQREEVDEALVDEEDEYD